MSTISIILTVIITLWALLWTEVNIIILTDTPPATVARQEIRDRHRYHGILASEWDDERQAYVFERDGRICKLF